jgi:hypothetical protein
MCPAMHDNVWRRKEQSILVCMCVWPLHHRVMRGIGVGSGPCDP